MSKERTAAVIAVAALVLGLAADVLLRWIPWGINVTVFAALFIGAAFVACRSAGRSVHPFAAIAAAIAAIGIAWRDAEILVVLDVFLLLLFLPLLALGAREVRMVAAGLSQIAVALVTTGVQAVIGLPQLVASDLPWRRAPRQSTARGLGVFVRGFLIALPALLIFGALLASADDAFAHLLTDLFAFDLGEVILHFLVIAVAAAICAGFLRSFALSGPAPSPPPRPGLLRLPAAETNVAVALINLLFATFVAVQFRYFFGGSETMRIGKLTYAEYARLGFFELVMVVALVGPMLLAVDWLIDKPNRRQVLLFRILAAVQIALVFVIAVSAYRRMQLYRDEYGLTEERLFATAFMIWLAVLLLWMMATVLTGRRERFAAGAFVTGVIAVVVLHAINPHEMIVRTNLARAVAGKRAFDLKYAMTLSDDAADAMARAGFEEFVAKPRPRGWRTWNLSRARAAELGRAYESNATPPRGRPGRE